MTAPAAFERLLDAVTATTGLVPRGNDRTRTARCPSHDDSTPSLSITRGNDRVLIHCMAGCHIDAVLDALKLTRADLYDDLRSRNGKTDLLRRGAIKPTAVVVAEYEYTDEHGKVLFVVQRREPKDFRQYRIVNGAKVWNLGDVRRVLFRLPEVLAAVAAGRTIWCVEGEADVHALERAGEVATCNPGGAGKWRPEFAKVLAGADVVIVADRDEPGRAHARAITASLTGHAKSMLVVEAAPGKDARDHLAAGHTVGEFQPVTSVPKQAPAADAGPGGPVTVRLADVQPERVDWLWTGRLPAGKLVILDGDPALGKSTIGLDLAARMSTGSRWPDGSPNRVGATVIMSAEDGLADTIRPRLDAAGADTSKVYALTEVRYTDSDGAARTRLPSLADLPSIEVAVTRTGARLLIIDVLMAYLGGGTDSHKDQDVRSVLHGLAALAERTGCCVLLLRHLNKSGAGAAMYRGGGSIGIIGAARAGFVVAPDPDDDSRRILAPLKCNLAAEPDSLAYRLVTAGHVARVQWEGTVAHKAGDILGQHEDDEERTERDEAVQWLTDYLAANGGEAKASDVIKAGRRDDIAERTLQRARKRAGVTSKRQGFGEGSVWTIPATVAPFLPGPETWHERHERGGNEPADHWLCVACHGQLDPVLAAEGAYWHPLCDEMATAE